MYIITPFLVNDKSWRIVPALSYNAKDIFLYWESTCENQNVWQHEVWRGRLQGQ